MGERGAYYDYEGGRGLMPAFAVKAVDTVGAGDAFNGGLAVALLEGREFPEAVRWGAAAGAIACTRPGAMPSMPYRQELEEFLQQRTSA